MPCYSVHYCSVRENSMKNITLSADEKLIAAARKQAANEESTLNAKFREWLESYVSKEQRFRQASAVINELQAKYTTEGKKYTRDEMNER